MSPRKRINLFLSGVNLLHRRPQPWNMPLHMQFELTNYCNLKCPVCPTGIRAIKRRTRNISPELFEAVFNQVGPYLLTASLWAWGEPCLHPELHEILRIAAKHDVTTFLSTNGQNLDNDAVLKAIVDNPPTYLIVAIDGLTDDTNSVFRIGARLEPALEGVRRLAAMKKELKSELPVLHMRFIVMKHNQHQVVDLQDFARKHGFDYLTVRTLSIIDTEAPDREHRPLIPEEKKLRAYHYQNEERIEKRDFYCLEPFWFPTVFADGSVVACEQDYNARMSMGTVFREHDFRKVWYSSKAAGIRRKIRDHPNNISFCHNCPYRDRDNTDVSIAAYSINREIDLQNLS